jgi:hypothetical protein
MLVNRSTAIACAWLRCRCALLTCCARYGIGQLGRGGKTGPLGRTEKQTSKRTRKENLSRSRLDSSICLRINAAIDSAG